MDLVDRKYRILQAIIDDYIMTALPVGSRTISRKYEQKLSSATIRNEMSDLEELGYLDSPHTSAGRIPSYKAYRLYVDRMIHPMPLSEEETAFIKSCFDHRINQVEELSAKIAKALSSMTHYTTAVMTRAPREEQVFSHLQLVPVSDRRLLLVIVTRSGAVRQTVIDTEKPIAPDALYTVSQIISRELEGCAMSQLPAELARLAGGQDGEMGELLGLLAAAAYLTVGAALPVLIARLGGNTGAQFRAQAGALSGYVLDSLRGLREVLQYHQGENRLAGLEERTEGLLHTEERMKGRAAWSMALTNTVILTFSLGMLAAAAGLYFAGAVGFDGVLIPLTALMSSFGPVVALANLGSTLQNTLAAGNRVLDILDEEPLVHEIAGRQTTAFSGAACEDVSFSYGEEPVLSRVSLRIPQGCVVGITGRSGSGKSTLLRLLMRFWDAAGGAVRVSGRDVREVNTGDLRRMEGFVTQETHLFRDSIASNLRIAKRDATQAELEAACKKASVHEFILSLPKGYDTPVGELGDTLSGGERQRLGLARAFLHDAPFLLLDEPTSNLDSLNEGVILRSLQSERGGRTVVLVSHRASTMAVADEVYAAQEGRVS